VKGERWLAEEGRPVAPPRSDEEGVLNVHMKVLRTKSPRTTNCACLYTVHEET